MPAHPSANSAEGWGTRVRGWERVGHPPIQEDIVPRTGNRNHNRSANDRELQ